MSDRDWSIGYNPGAYAAFAEPRPRALIDLGRHANVTCQNYVPEEMLTRLGEGFCPRCPAARLDPKTRRCERCGQYFRLFRCEEPGEDIVDGELILAVVELHNGAEMGDHYWPTDFTGVPVIPV